MEGNYNLSDLAAVMGNGNGFGGNNGLLMLLLIVFLIGGGTWGNRGMGEFGQYATASSQQEILFGQQFQGLNDRMDRGFTAIGNGISDATFALNNTIVNGTNNVAGTVIAEGRAMADKMCELKTAVHAEGEATRAMIQQNKIDTLQAQVNDLKMAQNFCGIPRINPYGYGIYAYQNQCGGCNCGNI